LNFGKREHPITKKVKEYNAIDIKAPEGTTVVPSKTEPGPSPTAVTACEAMLLPQGQIS